MGFERLRFFNFRNLRDGELPLGAREIFLVGENGQGKTNLIEAVHLLCRGSSFREKRETALFRDTGAPMGLQGQYAGTGTGGASISLQMSPDRKKEMRVNGKQVVDRRELLSEALCVCFVQQDMDVVTGAPDERRRFFDQTLTLCDPSFLDSLRGYRRVLRARNFCLKSRQIDILDAYDTQLAAFGLEMQRRREALVGEFNGVFCPLFRDMSGAAEAVEIRYLPSWQGLRDNETVAAHLAGRRNSDVALGTTTTGPHRDGYSFIAAERDYSHFGSTGQLRLCALALRVAQARFLTERTRRLPVLLIDDVLLELDQDRKKAIVERLPRYEQAFYTFLPDEAYASYRTPDTMILRVEKGEFHS